MSLRLRLASLLLAELSAPSIQFLYLRGIATMSRGLAVVALWARLSRRHREFRTHHRSSVTKYVAVVVLIILIIGVSAYTATRPSADYQDHQNSVAADQGTGATAAPLAAALSQEIQAALGRLSGQFWSLRWNP